MEKKIKQILAMLLMVVMVLSMAGCGNKSSASVTDDNVSNGNADMVIKNAEVFTADASDTVAQAVAIQDGMIVYVGNNEEVEKYVSDDTNVIDAQGATVTPGLVDSHMHPAQSAASYCYEITLQDGFSVDSYLTTIADFIEDNPDFDVYAGSGYMRSFFDEVGPRKELLDQICSDKPILLTSGDGHSMWVNSKAMELAGITKDTADPEGGVIKRDPNTKEPAGLLQESAMNLVSDLAPSYSKEQYKEAILWLQEELLAPQGVTTVFDAMVPLDNPNYYDAYGELAEEGKLKMRVRGAWHMYPEMGDQETLMEAVDKGIELSKNFTTPYFQMTSFKFFADQVLEEQTSYMSEPYSNRDDGWRGIKVWDDDLMFELFKKIDSAGFQIHTHQIGDEAATYTLDALEKVVEANGKKDSRHTLVHVQFLKDTDRQRIAALGLNALIAPYWSVADDYYWELYIPYVGEDRANHMYPAQSLIDAGINTAIHSDFFVTEPDPGWLYYSAVTRALPQKIFDIWYEDMELTRSADFAVPLENGLIGPLPQKEECMTLSGAVKAATYNGAYANFMENEIGSVEEGKQADLVLYSEDIFNEDIEQVANVEVMMTIFNGEVTYSNQ